jgi:hypothetical protein
MEDTLPAGGFHVGKGELLWNVYRNMEMAAFQTIRGRIS